MIEPLVDQRRLSEPHRSGCALTNQDRSQALASLDYEATKCDGHLIAVCIEIEATAKVKRLDGTKCCEDRAQLALAIRIPVLMALVCRERPAQAVQNGCLELGGQGFGSPRTAQHFVRGNRAASVR
jgi:hypothetical protein